MVRPFADLHVHSYYSDGGMSPKQLVEAAVSNGVGVLAIADHDVLEGSAEARELCIRAGVRHIPAVEIDTLDGETNFHILAYGFDMENHEFAAFLSHVRFLLDEQSVKLIERMQADYNGVSYADYLSFSYDKRLGGWKALHYLLAKGLTSSLKQGIGFYPRYGISYSISGYPTIAATAHRIKAAGGRAVLAHPGELIDTSDIAVFKAEIERLVAFGLDGVECYYPTNSEDVTHACLEVCHERGLLVTAGSDCHGVFGKTRVGEMNIGIDRLRLGGL